MDIQNIQNPQGYTPPPAPQGVPLPQVQQTQQTSQFTPQQTGELQTIVRNEMQAYINAHLGNAVRHQVEAQTPSVVATHIESLRKSNQLGSSPQVTVMVPPPRTAWGEVFHVAKIAVGVAAGGAAALAVNKYLLMP